MVGSVIKLISMLSVLAGCDITENFRNLLKTAENLRKTKLAKTNPNPIPTQPYKNH